ncbi:uncharacterized protein [Branchiostoma lanceolatum]|uniref:uncharacterized protein isoform X2 n=1 Tax=Branchiostoma lanceolatum TaxID=7740 RepID=UPI0034537AFF
MMVRVLSSVAMRLSKGRRVSMTTVMLFAAVAVLPILFQPAAANPPKKWREDARCGQGYPGKDGSPAECDPSGIYPCCSPANWCGNTADHCDCADCVDYRDTQSGTQLEHINTMD